MTTISVLAVLSSVFFIGGWCAFSMQFKHVLSALLCLEVCLVGALLGVLAMGPCSLDFFFFFVLGLGVCESALGLSLLVLYARAHSNDYFKGLDSQK